VFVFGRPSGLNQASSFPSGGLFSWAPPLDDAELHVVSQRPRVALFLAFSLIRVALSAGVFVALMRVREEECFEACNTCLETEWRQSNHAAPPAFATAHARAI